MVKYAKQGKGLIAQIYDIRAFFDNESLRDVLCSLYDAGVRGKAYRAFYLMNKKTTIRVVTGSGLTEEADVGEIVGQGSTGGAIVSQLNLDMGVNDLFFGSQDEAQYGTVVIQPQLFQDNIFRLTPSVSGARAGNVKMDCVI